MRTVFRFGHVALAVAFVFSLWALPVTQAIACETGVNCDSQPVDDGGWRVIGCDDPSNCKTWSCGEEEPIQIACNQMTGDGCKSQGLDGGWIEIATCMDGNGCKSQPLDGGWIKIACDTSTGAGCDTWPCGEQSPDPAA